MGRAGQPRPSRVKRIIFVLLLLLILGPIIAYFTVPAVRSRIDGLINDASIAFTLSRNPSDSALDKNAATYWLADPNAGVPTLTVNFTDTTDLAALTFLSGATPGADYQNHARPWRVELVFPGETQTVILELQDTPAPQTRCLGQNHSVRTFQMRIVSVFEADPGGQDLVALREVDFISGSCP
jgi:hypothetical protein